MHALHQPDQSWLSSHLPSRLAACAGTWACHLGLCSPAPPPGGALPDPGLQRPRHCMAAAGGCPAATGAAQADVCAGAADSPPGRHHHEPGHQPNDQVSSLSKREAFLLRSGMSLCLVKPSACAQVSCYISAWKVGNGCRYSWMDAM